jgi:hypothetical protein
MYDPVTPEYTKIKWSRLIELYLRVANFELLHTDFSLPDVDNWLPSNYLIRQLSMEPVEETTVNVYYKPRDMSLPRNEDAIHKSIEVKKIVW